MEEGSNHQLLPKNMKNGDRISCDKKMENSSLLKFPSKTMKIMKISDCINHDKVRQGRTDQNLWFKNPPIMYYSNHETSTIAVRQISPNISCPRNSSCIEDGSTMGPNIGSFNCMKSPDQEPDGIPGEDSTQSPRCQGSGPLIHKEGEDRALNEIPYESGTRISLHNSSGFFNHLNRQARGISASGIRYPPYFATVGLDGKNERSRISNETPGKIRRIRRIKSSWTKSKIGGSRPRDNSYPLNHSESPGHEPDTTFSFSRASLPATVGRNFMDYLIANYSHGIFDPHRNRLASRLSPDPKQSPDPAFVSSNQSALSSSSYIPKKDQILS